MDLPVHVAIIMDGNGRWAKAKGMPRTYGHTVGAANVEKICRAASDMGIKYVTFYAFSTENWSRPESEVSVIMKLLRDYLAKCRAMAKKNNMRVRVIGDRTRLDPQFIAAIDDVEEYTKDFDGFNMTIALNYGFRDEMRRAVTGIAERIKNGKLDPCDITEDTISGSLDTAGLPDPDLMIRTSGEQRLSNYLMWQLSYAELYFTDVPWPEFDGEELKKAVDVYMNRDRRFGGIKTEGE